MLIVQRKSRNSTSRKICIVVTVIIILLWRNTIISTSTILKIQPRDENISETINNEEQKVYYMKSNAPKFQFLDQVDIKKYTKETYTYTTLDLAHRHGEYHTGVWIYVTDITGKYVLLLQRGSQLVTCPNAWTIVGEHTIRDETPIETTKRALIEELWNNNNHYNNNNNNNIIQFIRNITIHPVLYIRDYGPELENRIDKQFTYLYEVRFTLPYQDIILELDDEVANYTWISIHDFQLSNENELTTNQYNINCHKTIVKLNLWSLQRLLALQN